MLFAEAEGFGHLHVHVVPRMPDFEPAVLGPRVFAYLSDDQDAWLPEGERDAMAMRLRLAMARLDKCGRRDSNPHARRHRYLKPARLPFRHSRWLAHPRRATGGLRHLGSRQPL